MKTIALSVVSVLAAVLTVGATWIGVASFEFPLCKVDVDRGRNLFAQRCASCHTAEAGQSSSFGPNLEQIGHLAQRRVPGMSAEEYLLESILHPAAFRLPGEQGVMPEDVSAGLTSDELLSVVGYLMTRQGKLDARRLVALADKAHSTIAKSHIEIDFDSVEEGRRLFLTKGGCIACHRLRDVPGFDLLAPSLLQAGLHDADYLREAIQQPHRHIAPGYEEWNIVLASGQQVQGRLLRRGPESVELLVERNGGSYAAQTIRFDDMDQEADGQPMIFVSRVSRMPNLPPGYLTDKEIDQIVSFLRTLR